MIGFEVELWHGGMIAGLGDSSRKFGMEGHRCRPSGALYFVDAFFYTDVAPLGLCILWMRFSTQMSPLWG